MMNPVHLSRAATAAFLLLGAVWAGALPEAVDRQVSREPVAGGVELIRIRQFDAEGWLNIFALEADLANPAVGLDSLLGNETLTRPERLTDLAERRGAVGAVNADFFFIRTTNAPLGVHFQTGEVVKSPTPGREMSFVMAPGEAAIGQAVFRGTVTTANRETRALNRWNEPMVAADQIGFYNRRWGARAQGTASADFAEVSGIVHAVAEAGGRVTALLEDAPGPEIPKDGFVLLGRGSGAEWLRARARPGARLAVDAKLDFPLEEAVAAVGGNPRLLRNGEIVAPDNPVHPRTAAGYNPETGRAWLVVVDGRSRSSRGVDFRDLAEIFLELGATEALNLDGGGSSTLVARDSLQARPLLRNVPSDGRIRLVPNGVGIFSRMPEQTTIHHLHLHPPAPVDEYLLSGREIRAVPGLPVEVAVSATDADGNPASLDPADIRWRVEPPSLGKVGDDGRFQPLASGRGTLTAGLRGREGIRVSIPLRIIGDPVALDIRPHELALNPGESVELSLLAADQLGYQAPVEVDGVDWEIRGGIGTLRGKRFTAGSEPGAGALAARLGRAEGILAVGVGGRPETLAVFTDAGDWRVNTVPPDQTEATLAFPTHPPFNRADRAVAGLRYDFSQTGRTRAAYLRPAAGDLALPGKPLRLGLQVYGDGNGGWLRGQVVDLFGVVQVIDFAREIDWTGWRHVEASMPAGLDFPASLRSIYVVETRTDRQYRGALAFDELTVVQAPVPDAELLAAKPPARDPANRPVPLPDGDGFRFIVFGDSKVEADKPVSPEVRVLQALIEEINREEVDFVLYTGDLMENDTEANYQFAKRFLDQIIHPWHTTIANHEIAGSNSDERFRRYFGETRGTFTHGNALFITLNTARPGPRASDPDQWPWFRRQLEGADAENLFLLTHTPVIDPRPGVNTGWTDPAEAGLFQHLLAGQADLGRNVFVFHGHVHGFHRRAHDGVNYLISAGGGSPLYLPPHQGGFFHYVIVTVKGGDVTYQVIPLLESIEVEPHLTGRVGEPVSLAATGVAPDGLVRFPLAYPAAVRWRVVDGEGGVIDGEAKTFTADRSGEYRLLVESGGHRAEARITVP